MDAPSPCVVTSREVSEFPRKKQSVMLVASCRVRQLFRERGHEDWTAIAMAGWPVHSRVLLPPQESLSFRNVNLKEKKSRCEFLTDSLYLASWAAAGWEEQCHVVGVGEGQAGAARGLPPHGPNVAAESERHTAPRGGHDGHPGAHGGRRGRRGAPGHLLAPRRR